MSQGAKVKTSEEIVGISPQPTALCPQIDEALRMARSGCDFSEIELQLEAVRLRVEELRDWGQDWKEEALRRIREADFELYDQIEQARAKRGDAN